LLHPAAAAVLMQDSCHPNVLLLQLLLLP
jgi:hypothetical protein